MRLLVMLITFAIFLATTTTIAWGNTSPAIYAEAACLINAGTKQIIYEKQADIRMYPASTTKIMTLMVALKRGDLDSTVTVDADAAGCEGSSLYLNEGDKLTLRNLLEGMMLVSGNDAAEAAAKHIGGSRETFIEWMNNEAVKAGTSDTNFTNPHGLPDNNHYTTARDLALITASAYTVPGFALIVSSPEKIIRVSDESRQVTNTNKLLWHYRGANGVKTGYTNAAGCCLVAAAKRDDVQLVAVILNSDERWEDAAKLLDYGFQEFEKDLNKKPQSIKKTAS